jgi:hypothetical protein
MAVEEIFREAFHELYQPLYGNRVTTHPKHDNSFTILISLVYVTSATEAV